MAPNRISNLKYKPHLLSRPHQQPKCIDCFSEHLLSPFYVPCTAVGQGVEDTQLSEKTDTTPVLMEIKE